jgi:heme a synthase
VLLVCATFPLIWVGGLVTTYDAGMAVPDWPSTFGYNLFLYPWQTWVYGPWNVFIEHGHRLFGAAVGLLTILLVVVVWRYDSRRWMHALSLTALMAVIFQGLLGGLRVLLDERTLAQIHGCFGPAFFALAVALAAFTSRRWAQTSPAATYAASQTPDAKLPRLALLTTVLAYLQIVLGSQVRHVRADADASSFRGAVLLHLAMAGVVAVHVLLVVFRTLRYHRGEAALVWPAVVLVILLLAQLALGVAAWVTNYGPIPWLSGYAWSQEYVITQKGQVQALVTTAHAAGGSLVLVTSQLIALRSLRLRRILSSVAGRPLAAGVPA